jgi:hypothetical protein
MKEHEFENCFAEYIDRLILKASLEKLSDLYTNEESMRLQKEMKNKQLRVFLIKYFKSVSG